MPYCKQCGQGFTRDEHLERHILTHTGVKPFRCSECDMDFGRKDLLQRHYAVHGKNHNNEEGLPLNYGTMLKSAGRTPIACTSCAKTKTKCDKKFPCSRCESRNLHCTLRPTRRVSKQTVNRVEPRSTLEGSDSAASPQIDEIVINGSSSSSPQNVPPTQARTPLPPQNPTHEDDSNHTDRPIQIVNESPHMSQSSRVPSLISPLSTPNGFINDTPMTSFDEFVQAAASNAGSGSNSDLSGSPHFFMDWTQMQVSGGFVPQMLIPGDTGLGLDMCAITASAGSDGMLSMIPELTHTLPQVTTPLQTQRIEPCFGDMELGGGSAHSQQSTFSNYFTSTTRHTSVSDSGGVDLGVVVAAQEGWNVFRCTPPLPPHIVPKTARANLEQLEASLKNHEVWSNWRPSWNDSDFQTPDTLHVIPLYESTRDKLLAITQTFLHKALEIHRDGGNPHPGSQTNYYRGSNFVLLPPAGVLQCFLRSYANSFETFFPLSARGVVDTNELLSSHNDKAGSLLVLMMIAQGAMIMPSAEARSLTGGLTEACRISLFDAIEKNIALASDAAVLRAALLFIVQAAWSGDKWQMDIAMGQRGMYLAMLRHSGMMLESTSQSSASVVSLNGASDGVWREWVAHESQSRLIYSWVMVDQDLSLFHDSAPLLNISDFCTPLPDVDRLWHAQSTGDWSEGLHQLRAFEGEDTRSRPLSLRDLFRILLDDEIATRGILLTPLHLRLLLHPLQSLVCQYNQLLHCFSFDDTTHSGNNSNNPSRATTPAANSARHRLDEIQTLLQRWFILAECYIAENPICAPMQAALVIFHLLSLNIVTNFDEIEKLARCEGFDGTYAGLLRVHQRCISNVQEAIFHCGQIMRHIRSMLPTVRPPWWPGAVYRVALVLWTDALRHNENASNTGASNSPLQTRQSSIGSINSISGGAMFVPSQPAHQTSQHQSPTRAVSSHSLAHPPIVPSSTVSHPPFVAVDSLPATHPLLTVYLTQGEGIPVLTPSHGNMHVGLTNAFTVLSHCVDVLDEGAPTRFSDGIRGKLQRLTR